MDNNQNNNDINNQGSLSNQTPQDIKKQETKESYDKLTHEAGKGAATYFGGAIGNKAYDIASKTKAGQKIEQGASKILQKSSNPILNHGVNTLNKSGALDAEDTAIDAVGGNATGAAKKIGNQNVNKNMLKGNRASSTTLNNNNRLRNMNSINRGHNLVNPNNINNEVPEGLSPEEEELYREQLLEEQRQQEITKKDQEKKEKKKQTIKMIGEFFTKNPAALLVVLAVILVILVLGFLIYFSVSDIDLVGTDGMTKYNDAKTVTGYCTDITLIKEHPQFSGKDVDSIDDVDLEETFMLNKVSTKRWTYQTYSLEDYIDGVVLAEAADVNDEKTFEVAAIVARTYALQITSKLCRTWDNDNKNFKYHNPQRFDSSKSNKDVSTAVSTTYGIVMMYENKLLDLSEHRYYDYFCNVGKIRDDTENKTFYKTLQQNKEERLQVPVDWIKQNGAENKNYSGKFKGGIYTNDCQQNGLNLYGTKYLLNKTVDAYNTLRILNYYYGYDIDIRKVESLRVSGCSDFSMTSTNLSRNEFISLVNSFISSNANFYVLQKYAGEIYDLSIANSFNPELVFARAEVEGYSPGFSTYNYYGIRCTNTGGAKNCKNYSGVMDGVLDFININKGYNVPTLFDVYNVKHYAYIGDSWIKGNSSVGGCYYLPYMAQYYSNPSRYAMIKNACDSGTGASIATNSEDQAAYSYFQIEKMTQMRKKIFNIDSDNCGAAGAASQQEINNIVNSNASTGVKAAQLAVAMFDSFGYSQGERWGDSHVDCSSLVARTYRQLGINFDGNSTVKTEYSWCQANNRMIAESQLQPGDLLFKGDLSHVEIYIGNGQRFGAHSAKYAPADQVSIKTYTSGTFTKFCRPY